MMKYRAEIDGLRAIAVVSVILFHAGFESFSGGFVGVDVFFVISGYLITTILIEDIQSGRFSVSNFYERRARRILPVLFFVMLTCIPFAWMWMFPYQISEFTQSLMAVSFFVSNMFFWKKSDYFGPENGELPLLHTWSLAVEEQYYVLFPLFLLLTWRIGKNRVFWIIIVLATLSLMLSEWGWRNKPDANFYLLISRAWEIFSGSIAAFILQSRGVKSSNILSFSGLSAILFAIFVFDSTTPFPSVYALVPVIGAVFIILFAGDTTLVARFLSIKPMVGIGLVSYSAYLWHQPIFAFARIRVIEPPSASLMLLLSFATLGLAVLSWRFVETPFREKNRYSKTSIFLMAIMGAASMLVINLIVTKTPIVYTRYSAVQIDVLRDRDANRDFMTSHAYDRFGCFFDYSQPASVLVDNNCIEESLGKRIILFGDSEAAHYLEGFRLLQEVHNASVMQFTGASCRAIDIAKTGSRCSDFFDIFEKDVAPNLSPNDTVIVASNWWNSHRRMGDHEFYEALSATVNLISSFGAKVVLIGNTPDFTRDPYEQLSVLENPNVQVSLSVQDYVASDLIISKVASETLAGVTLPADILCEGLLCSFRDDEEYLFFDAGHLSSYGSTLIASEILREMSINE